MSSRYNNSLVPTPIVNKNGVATTVYRRIEPVTSARLGNLAEAAAQRGALDLPTLDPTLMYKFTKDHPAGIPLVSAGISIPKHEAAYWTPASKRDVELYDIFWMKHEEAMTNGLSMEEAEAEAHVALEKAVDDAIQSHTAKSKAVRGHNFRINGEVAKYVGGDYDAEEGCFRLHFKSANDGDFALMTDGGIDTFEPLERTPYYKETDGFQAHDPLSNAGYYVGHPVVAHTVDELVRAIRTATGEEIPSMNSSYPVLSAIGSMGDDNITLTFTSIDNKESVTYSYNPDDPAYKDIKINALRKPAAAYDPEVLK